MLEESQKISKEKNGESSCDVELTEEDGKRSFRMASSLQPDI
jgi:hypothetical protein